EHLVERRQECAQIFCAAFAGPQKIDARGKDRTLCGDDNRLGWRLLQPRELAGDGTAELGVKRVCLAVRQRDERNLAVMGNADHRAAPCCSVAREDASCGTSCGRRASACSTVVVKTTMAKP